MSAIPWPILLQGYPVRRFLKFAKWLLVVLVAALCGLAGWLFVAPPELIQVGSAYSANSQHNATS